MMRNNLGAFENGLNSDLDLDATQDFVNQAGSFSFTTPSMLGLDFTPSESAATTSCSNAEFRSRYPALCGAQDRQNPPSTSSTSTQDLLAQRRNKGKGLGAFAKGLGQGLGLLGGGQQQQPVQQQAQATEPSQAGFQKERGDWVIPALIGAIGLAVVIFAVSQSKKGTSSAQLTPTS